MVSDQKCMSQTRIGTFDNGNTDSSIFCKCRQISDLPMPKSLTPPDMNAARASRKKCGSSVSGRDLPDGFTAKSDFATEASLLPDFQCPIPIGDGSSLPVSTMIFTFQYNPQLCEVQIKFSSTTCAASELESVKIRRRNIAPPLKSSMHKKIIEKATGRKDLIWEW